MKSKQVFVTLFQFLALLTLSSGSSLIPSSPGGAEDNKTSSSNVAAAVDSRVESSRSLLRGRVIQDTSSSAIDGSGVDRRLDEKDLSKAELQEAMHGPFHDSGPGRVVFYLALAFACPLICYCFLPYCISSQGNDDDDDANEDSKEDKSATTFDSRLSRSSSLEDLEDSSHQQSNPSNNSVDS